MTAPPPIDVIIDTDVLLGLIKSGRIDILGKLTRFRFHTTDINARKEVKAQNQRDDLAAAADKSWIKIIKFEDINALQTFAQLRRWQLGEGESAVIAQALVMGARVAMHDAAGKSAARAKLGAGQCHSLADIMVEAVREKVLTVGECDKIVESLRAQNDYRFLWLKGGFQTIATDANYGIPP